MQEPLHQSSLSSLPLLARGKVRDMYAVGEDKLLIVASDRISAFDVILDDPIPGKGVILTQLSEFWFDHTGHLVANHRSGLTPADVAGVVAFLASDDASFMTASQFVVDGGITANDLCMQIQADVLGVPVSRP